MVLNAGEEKATSSLRIAPKFRLQWSRSEQRDYPGDRSGWLDPQGERLGWQHNNAREVSFVKYAHHNVLRSYGATGGGWEWGDRDTPGVGGHGHYAFQVIQRGSPVARTNRLPDDANLGPHLHLFMQTQDGRDTAWQERYFDPMPEVPLHAYLSAVCLYGWTQGGFGFYSWDWFDDMAHQIGCCAEHLCMGVWGHKHAGGPWTLGQCARFCQAYIAEKLVPGDTEGRGNRCGEALKDPRFWEEYLTAGSGKSCTSCCDDRFSDFLMMYFNNAASWGLPMEWTWYRESPTGNGYTGPRIWRYEWDAGAQTGTWRLGGWGIGMGQIVLNGQWGMWWLMQKYGYFAVSKTGNCVERMWQDYGSHYDPNYCYSGEEQGNVYEWSDHPL